MTTSRKISSLLLFIVLPILLAVLVQQKLSQYQPYGTAFLKPKVVGVADLSMSGKKLSDYQGKAVLVFFGFLNCPDICPTTMFELGKVHRALTPAEQAKTQVLMATVDPERDSDALLERYVKSFDPSFVGLRGTPEQTAKFATGFAVAYEKTGDTSGKDYGMQHTSSVFALDPNGKLRLIYRSDMVPETAKMVKDIRWLLK